MRRDFSRPWLLQVLQGKKGAGGIVVAKSNKAIVIGVYSAESGIQVLCTVSFLCGVCTHCFLCRAPSGWARFCSCSSDGCRPEKEGLLGSPFVLSSSRRSFSGVCVQALMVSASLLDFCEPNSAH